MPACDRCRDNVVCHHTIEHPMTPCSHCGTRWPANTLDNFGRCAVCGLDDRPAVRRDAVRAAVRVTAKDLRPGDTVQPWNDRAAPHRTVWVTRPGDGGLWILWTDRTSTHVNRYAVFHRSDVRL